MSRAGRPPKETTLTPAERARRYREKKKQNPTSGVVEPSPAEYRATIKKLQLELIEAKSIVVTLQPALMRANEQVLIQQRRIDELATCVAENQAKLAEAWKAEEEASQELNRVLEDIAKLVRRASDAHIDPCEIAELLRRYGFGYEEWLGSCVFDTESDRLILKDFS